MEIISTKGADLLALRQVITPPIKRYKSSDRSAVSELANLQARTNPGSTIRKAMTKKAVFIRRLFYGVPGGIRTHDPRRRRPILYPTELRVHQTNTILLHRFSTLFQQNFALFSTFTPHFTKFHLTICLNLCINKQQVLFKR